MNNDKAVFPILGKFKDDPEKYIILATGFFIDNNGLFVTAGHTFRKNIYSISQFFISFLEKEKSELIPITTFKWISRKVYAEEERRDKVVRDRKKYQCGPEFTDIAIGRVELSETPFYTLQKKRPYEWQKLNSPCYNRNKKTCPDAIVKIQDNLIDSSYIEFSDKSFKLIDRLQFARIYFMGEKYDYKNIDLFNNCIEVEGKMVKGNSGAPVINEKNKVIGIIIGGGDFSPTFIHLSKYISKKVRKLKKIL